MSALRVLLHGFLLFGGNLAGIVIGFAAWRLLGGGDQLAVQVPVALLGSLTLYLLGAGAADRVFRGLLSLRNPPEGWWAFGAALVWGPLVFVPLHFLTEGYVTSPANLVALALFQLVANGPVLLLGRWVGSGMDRDLERRGRNPGSVVSHAADFP